MKRELHRISKVLRYPVPVTKFTVSFEAVQLGVEVVMPTTTGTKARIEIDSRKNIVLDEALIIDVRISSLPTTEVARPRQIADVGR